MVIYARFPTSKNVSSKYGHIIYHSIGHFMLNKSSFGTHVWFLGVSLSWRTIGEQVRKSTDQCRQLWFLGVSLTWRTFGGQVWTGADNSGFWVSL